MNWRGNMRVSMFAFMLLPVVGRALAHADSSSASPTQPGRRLVKVEVSSITLNAFKADGAAWDGTRKLAEIPTPNSTDPRIVAAVALKKVVEMGLEATAAPDVYFVIEAGGKRLEGSVAFDTYQPIWEEMGTFSLSAGEDLDVRVFDQDLQENTRDPIGHVVHKVTQAELDGGIVSLGGFHQVLAMDLKLAAVAKAELLYPPGRYTVKITGGSISPTKPAQDRNAGKAWDAFGGLPDVQGRATVGPAPSMLLLKNADTNTPVWPDASAVGVDLDEASSLWVKLDDLDLTDRTQDPVGWIFVPQILAVAPGPDDRIHLSNRAAILDLTVELKEVAMPTTTAECRSLDERLAALADDAGEKQAANAYRTPDQTRLRRCVGTMTHANIGCAIAAPSFAAANNCLPQGVSPVEKAVTELPTLTGQIPHPDVTSPDPVADAVMSASSALAECAARYPAQGSIRFKVVVAANGKSTASLAEKPKSGKDFIKCASTAVRATRFPSTGKKYRLSIPFSLGALASEAR